MIGPCSPKTCPSGTESMAKNSSPVFWTLQFGLVWSPQLSITSPVVQA